MRFQFKLFFITSMFFSTSLLAEETIKTIEQRKEFISKGLAFLAKHQNAKGSWTGGYDTAITGFAGLAFLSAGHTPNEGQYAPVVNKAVEALLGKQSKNGFLNLGGNDDRPMYGHGYATLFLAQVYGMDPSHGDLLRRALQKAVTFIVANQSAVGGWYYTPGHRSDEGSVTITQVQALRACRDAGLKVPFETIKKSIQYVKESQETDGGIAYGVRQRGNATVPLTAAGMAVLFNAGQYEIGDTQLKGFRYLDRHMIDLLNPHGGGHFFYTHFYAAQVYKQRGEEFNRYFQEIQKILLSAVKTDVDGSKYWDGEQTPVYATAIALMILSLPLEYLPMFIN